MHSIRKSDDTEIRIRRSIYKGRDILDVRLFFRPRSGGELVPSGKGVGFDVAKARAVIDAMEAELLCAPVAEEASQT